MARDQKPQKPWYRSSGATFAAGLLGLALITGLVLLVIRMSGQWNVRDSEVVVPPGTHMPEPPHVVGTTAGSSTSYTTVHVSTTDIGLPTESGTSSSTTPSSTTSGTDTPSTSTSPPPAVAPTFPGTFPTRVTHPPGTRGPTKPGQ
jgi:hypothetical protein